MSIFMIPNNLFCIHRNLEKVILDINLYVEYFKIRYNSMYPD
jgi:hypothetical protein